MKYHTFQISIPSQSGLKFIKVVAADMQSAHADVRETYGPDVEIVGAVLL